MTNLATTLKQEIRRIVRRELKAELSPTKKAVSRHLRSKPKRSRASDGISM